MSSNLFLIAGPCIVEDEATCMEIGHEVKRICDKLDIEYIFKASYKKANRTRIDGFTGIGNEKALKIIQAVGKTAGVSTITDVHESYECAEAAPYVDYLQIPAFLCRQTDLLIAAGKTGKGVNIKKGQWMAPESMQYALEKVKSTGNDKIWITDRGSIFGYHDLIVDFTGIPKMQAFGATVVVDCTHSVQKPNQAAGFTGGDSGMIETICRAACAVGTNGLFLEVHPDPGIAKSDASSMLQLSKLEAILEVCVKLKAI